jgi:hypothetical protein
MVADWVFVQTSELLAERLQAWKHAVGYLEEFVSATEKVQKAHAKEYEKVLKVRIVFAEVLQHLR